jgi:hypothetical protein
MVGTGDTSADGRSRAKTATKGTGLDRGYGTWGEEERDRAVGKPAVSAIAKNTEGQDDLRPAKSKEIPIRKPASTDDGASGPLTLGFFIRMLLIIAIVIFIVIFMGGQLLQVSKSSEK